MRHGTGQISPLGQIRRRRFVGRQAQLEGHRVFAQDIGQAFKLSVRGCEESHAITALDHVLGFGDRYLHAAVEGHGRAGGDVGRGRVQIEFAERDLPALSEAAFKLFPVEKAGGRKLGGVFLLIEPLPQPLGGATDLLRLVEHNQRPGFEIKQSLLAPVFERRREFPAGIGGADARLLSERQHFNLRELHHRALALDLEAANRFNLVTEEFDAQRTCVFGREDVEDAAADRILAGHFHRLALLVADRNQMRFDGL